MMTTLNYDEKDSNSQKHQTLSKVKDDYHTFNNVVKQDNPFISSSPGGFNDDASQEEIGMQSNFVNEVQKALTILPPTKKPKEKFNNKNRFLIMNQNSASDDLNRVVSFAKNPHEFG